MRTRSSLCVLLIVTLAPCTSVPAEERIAYTLKQPGNVSLAVYDTEGVQVRTLLSAVSHETGEHAIAWDGLDRNGRPVAPGTYNWKLLRTPGLTSKYLLSVGTSTRHEHWPGAHNGPAAVAVDPRQGHVYMAAGGVEGGSQVVKMTLDGKVLWTHRSYEGWGHLRDMVFSRAPLEIGENDYPDGALYIPHCSSGILHVADARDGHGHIDRSLVKQYVADGQVTPLRAALVRADLGAAAGPVEPGWQPATVEEYSATRGFGWEDSAGIEVASGEDGALTCDGHAFTPTAEGQRRAFLVTIPTGCRFCRVRLTVGGNVDDLKIFSGLSYGKPKPMRPTVTDDGSCKTLEFECKPKGVLDITLAGDSGWIVHGVEVLVTLDRLDAHNGKVMAAFTHADRIQRISTDTWLPVAETVVPELSDVAVLADGTVLALSGDKVVVVDEEGMAHRPVIEGLTEPKCLSIDRGTGELFIAEWGNSHQVKRFSSDYKLLGTFGRRGGRRQGVYEPEDFLEVADIAGDGRGGFFVVELGIAPRRLAHFDAEGRLIKEWYGGQLFFTNASLDRRQPNRLWMNSHFGWLIEADVDWEAGEWRPHATYKYDGLADNLIQTSRGGHHWLLRYHDGERYLVYTKCPRVLKVDEPNRRLLPVISSDVNVAKAPAGLPDWLARMLGKSKKTKAYVWTDTDGDGKPAQEETVLSSWSVFGLRWFVDDDFSYCGAYPVRNPGGPGPHYAVRTLTPTWRDAVPVYPPFENAKESPLATDESFRQPTGPQAGQLAELKAFYRDPDGNCYLITHGAGDYYTARGGANMSHGYRWPSDLIDGTAFAKWDAKGRLLWKVGPHASQRESHLRGRLNWPTRIVGRAHGCIGVQDRIVQPLELWTEDGLYAGSLFDRRADDGLPEVCYNWFRVRHDIQDWATARALSNTAVLQYDMNAGGELTEHGDDALFLGAGWNNLPTYRLSGWKDFKRLEGDLHVVAPATAARGQGTGLRGEYFTGTDLTGEPALRRVDQQIWFGTEGKKQLPMPWPEHAVTAGPFSARWTGHLEPRFTETYRFSIYLRRGQKPETARLWIGGKLVLDASEQEAGEGFKYRSSLVPLRAGVKVPITLEYAKSGPGELHLCWESASEEIEHVPGGYLYPDE